MLYLTGGFPTLPTEYESREKAMSLSDGSSGGILAEPKADPRTGKQPNSAVGKAGGTDNDCPECGGPHVRRCRCRLADSVCENGHEWHRCPDCGDTVTGESFHDGSGENRCKGCVGQTREKGAVPPYKYASTQIDIPTVVAQQVQELAAVIRPDDLDEKGVERESHVTVRYGLTCGVGQVQAVADKFPPVEYQIGGFDVFERPGKPDVLYLAVTSRDLIRLNRLLCDLPGKESDYEEYHPHCTVAYLKPGTGAVYAAAFNGVLSLKAMAVAREFAFTDEGGRLTRVTLGGQPGEHQTTAAVSALSPVTGMSVGGIRQKSAKSDDESDDDHPFMHEIAGHAVELLNGHRRHREKAAGAPRQPKSPKMPGGASPPPPAAPSPPTSQPAAPPPASSNLDHLVGAMTNRPRVGKAMAGYVNLHPDEAARLAVSPPPASPPASPPPPPPAQRPNSAISPPQSASPPPAYKPLQSAPIDRTNHALDDHFASPPPPPAPPPNDANMRHNPDLDSAFGVAPPRPKAPPVAPPPPAQKPTQRPNSAAAKPTGSSAKPVTDPVANHDHLVKVYGGHGTNALRQMHQAGKQVMATHAQTVAKLPLGSRERAEHFDQVASLHAAGRASGTLLGQRGQQAEQSSDLPPEFHAEHRAAKEAWAADVAKRQTGRQPVGGQQANSSRQPAPALPTAHRPNSSAPIPSAKLGSGGQAVHQPQAAPPQQPAEKPHERAAREHYEAVQAWQRKNLGGAKNAGQGGSAGQPAPQTQQSAGWPTPNPPPSQPPAQRPSPQHDPDATREMPTPSGTTPPVGHQSPAATTQPANRPPAQHGHPANQDIPTVHPLPRATRVNSTLPVAQRANRQQQNKPTGFDHVMNAVGDFMGATDTTRRATGPTAGQRVGAAAKAVGDGVRGAVSNVGKRVTSAVTHTADRARNAVDPTRNRTAKVQNPWADEAQKQHPVPPQMARRALPVAKRINEQATTPAHKDVLANAAKWADRVGAHHADKVAHLFGGDKERAAKALSRVVRHLAHIAHSNGSGSEAFTEYGGHKFTVRKKAFDPDDLFTPYEPQSDVPTVEARHDQTAEFGRPPADTDTCPKCGGSDAAPFRSPVYALVCSHCGAKFELSRYGRKKGYPDALPVGYHAVTDHAGRFIRLAEISTREKTAQHAPHTTTIGGREYHGGEFVPGGGSAVVGKLADQKEDKKGGGEGESVKPNDGGPSGGRLKAILQAAAKIDVTDDRMAGEQEPISRRDISAIEDILTPHERAEMEGHLDEQAKVYAKTADVDIADRDTMAKEIGWSDEDVRDKAVAMIDDMPDDWREEFGEAARDEITDWYDDTNKHGEGAIRELSRRLQADEDFDALGVKVDELHGEAESEIDTATEDEEKKQQEAMLDNYDSSGDRRDWLRNFWDENQHDARISGESDNAEEGKWGRNEDGDHVFHFSTSGGDKFKAVCWENNSLIGKVPEFAFSDADGQFKVTGAGGAHEVFGAVVPAAVALITKKDLPAVTFTAAEPSRRRLYDRLVRTVAAATPGYAAVATVAGGTKRYVVAKRDAMKTIMDHVANTMPGVPVETVVKAMGGPRLPRGWEHLPRASGAEIDHWHTPEAWSDDQSENGRDQKVGNREKGMGGQQQPPILSEGDWADSDDDGEPTVPGDDGGPWQWPPDPQGEHRREKAARHAPHNENIGGRDYHGGQFVPKGGDGGQSPGKAEAGPKPAKPGAERFQDNADHPPYQGTGEAWDTPTWVPAGKTPTGNLRWMHGEEGHIRTGNRPREDGADQKRQTHAKRQERLQKKPTAVVSRQDDNPEETTRRVAAAYGDRGMSGVVSTLRPPMGTEMTVFSAPWQLHVNLYHPDVDNWSRTAHFHPEGTFSVSNNLFFLKPGARGGGMGTKAFAAQVQGMVYEGGTAISTNAGKGGAGGDKMNGYYTWARLGYDAPLDADVRRKLPEHLRGAKSVQDLMATPEGAAAWKQHGKMTVMHFNTTPGSRSLTVLNSYLKSKGLDEIEHGEKAKSVRTREITERKERFAASSRAADAKSSA